MRKMRNLKTLTAVTLAASMVLGSAMNVMAAGSGDPTSTTSTSVGTYEGGDMEYPLLKVTLPVISNGHYDYIADPNGLIQATVTASGDAAKYANSKFVGDKGIFFLTTASDAEGNAEGKNIWTEKSDAKVVQNQSAKDVDVTVKIEQGTNAGDIGAEENGIAYAESDDFTDSTAKELYLAVVDKDGKASALSSSKAAEVTTTVAGTKENFKGGYDSGTGEYGYTLKPEGEQTAWKDCSFYLTGALNMNATWEKEVAFPDIVVTWSYEEHTSAAAPSVPTTTNFTYSLAAGGDLEIPCDLAAANATEISDFTMNKCKDGIDYAINGAWGCPSSSGNTVISGNKIIVKEKWLKWNGAGTYPCFVLFGSTTNRASITITITE